MQNPQFVKDLEFIKWQIENKTPQEALMVVSIVMKRYTEPKVTADVSDPGSDNICDSCQ